MAVTKCNSKSSRIFIAAVMVETEAYGVDYETPLSGYTALKARSLASALNITMGNTEVENYGGVLRDKHKIPTYEYVESGSVSMPFYKTLGEDLLEILKIGFGKVRDIRATDVSGVVIASTSTGTPAVQTIEVQPSAASSLDALEVGDILKFTDDSGDYYSAVKTKTANATTPANWDIVLDHPTRQAIELGGVTLMKPVEMYDPYCYTDPDKYIKIFVATADEYILLRYCKPGFNLETAGANEAANMIMNFNCYDAITLSTSDGEAILASITIPQPDVFVLSNKYQLNYDNQTKEGTTMLTTVFNRENTRWEEAVNEKGAVDGINDVTEEGVSGELETRDNKEFFRTLRDANTPFSLYYELGYPENNALVTQVILFTEKAKLLGGGNRITEKNNRNVFKNPLSYNQYQDSSMWVCLNPADFGA